MAREPSEAQEVEKDKEIDQKKHPDLSVTHGQAAKPMKTEESEEKPNAACVAALDTILKSLRKIKVFFSDVKISCCQETHQRFVDVYLGQLHGDFLRNLSLTRPLEENGIGDILVTVLNLLPRWDRPFELCEMLEKNCNRCKTDMKYEAPCSYGIIITANSLRETKSVLKHFSFEKILKVIRINFKMLCKREGCGKRSYVERVIKILPSVLSGRTMRLEERDETISVFSTEIDISVIYQFDGDCPYTKYHLVSMVCLHGDQCNCIGYENNTWVRHFGTEEEVIGEWDSVLSTFKKLNMPPQILFFENVSNLDCIIALRFCFLVCLFSQFHLLEFQVEERELIVNKQRDTRRDLDSMLAKLAEQR
ncbi:unnamed protein product [Thlaspi arvense]|uniref:Uncharacterized protein n=1 Tax=Thlaspi arvense TaxID=13288 RepID=A0AAU9SKF5_THLAR|nr:unnamed protein product [Thlaspi arvense]